jgi:hypothetical protein
MFPAEVPITNYGLRFKGVQGFINYPVPYEAKDAFGRHLKMCCVKGFHKVDVSG